MTAAALAASCRSPEELYCADCSAGGQAGAAASFEQGGTPSEPAGGAPALSGRGGTPSASAGGSAATTPPRGESGASGSEDAGGNAGEPVAATRDCTNDDDCVDAEACNGAERCERGRCKASRAVQCPTISECFEADAGAACRYSASERFVVYTGDEFGEPPNAVALSIARLERPVRLNFSEGMLDEEFDFVRTYSWSPNGRRLVVAAQCADFEKDVWDQKFYWLDVTEALDGQPRRLPNVRIDDDGTFELLAWSPTSNAVVIGRDAERYGVRFTRAGAETALLAPLGRIQLCGDDATVAYATEGETRLSAAWGPPADETVLPATLLSASPDGRWLLLSDESRAYLARCGAGSALEALGGPAGVTSSWSPKSEYVVYADAASNTLEEPTPKALSAFRVESSSTHAALFEAVAADPLVSFEPRSTRFLFVEQTPDDARVFQLVELENPSSRVVLPLPGELASALSNNVLGRTAWLGTTGALGYDTSEGEAPGMYRLQATVGAVPRLLAPAGSFGAYRFSDDGTRAIWLESSGGGFDARSQVYTLDLTRSDSEPHALFAEPLTGMVSLADARIVARFSQAPALAMDLFAVPSDFAGEPVPINAGKATGGPALQPRP